MLKKCYAVLRIWSVCGNREYRILISEYENIRDVWKSSKVNAESFFLPGLAVNVVYKAVFDFV